MIFSPNLWWFTVRGGPVDTGTTNRVWLVPPILGSRCRDYIAPEAKSQSERTSLNPGAILP